MKLLQRVTKDSAWFDGYSFADCLLAKAIAENDSVIELALSASLISGAANTSPQPSLM